MFDKEIKDNLYAILGPTNTGKTFLAFERMLGYQTGMFGFPLRLLARENYDRAVKKISSENVALITGEEKIIPKNAKYFFCTVESMPIKKNLDFVAIDEIQLCADFERGHIFTDRLLNLRGKHETVLLGSLIIKKILKELIPNIRIETRERFSKLSYTKKENIAKLKPRSAVIAFNVNEVYEIAEILRSQKGGAAVVLGALSPRTRNSQVEMYENKNVDYLVATDAIGMGLNLNINHVTFSSLKKFDGRLNRNLNVSEISQIAGRAGRYKNDGTFGLTKGNHNLDPLSIEAIENHDFELLKKIYWRNSNIDFKSISSVLNSLSLNPPNEILIKKKNAIDERSFRFLSKDDNIKNYISSSDNIKILWDVCRVPDYQKLMTESYFDFLKNVFIHLMSNNNYLPDFWINENVKRLDNVNGDIDSLSKRIGYIRTWTYISNHADWIINKEFWRKKTRNIEDRLSDELHNKLKLRFVDQQVSYFVDKINKINNFDIQIDNNNIINEQKSSIGSVKGFNFVLNEADKSKISSHAINSIKKEISKMISEKIESFMKAPSEAFQFKDISKIKINEDIEIYWGEEPIAILEKGKNIFSPNINIINSDLLDFASKDKMSKKLQKWIDEKISNLLKPIQENTNNISSHPSVRSIAYTLFQDLGSTHKSDFPSLPKNLTDKEKKDLSKLGIRTGFEFFYFPSFMKKSAIEIRAILWKIFYSHKLNEYLPLPTDGRVYFQTKLSMPKNYWPAIGYFKINNLVLRIDIFERLFFLIRKKYRFGTFIQHSDLMNLIGCNSNQLREILLYLKYDSILMGNDQLLFVLKHESKIKTKKIDKKKDIRNKLNVQKTNKGFANLGLYFNK